MNFEPRIILGASLGNNLDAKTTSVRTMNDRAPTPQQLAMLARAYDQHLTRTRLGLPGFTTTNGFLPDGSAYRVVSNSGMHTVMVWPVGGSVPPELLGEWFRAIPASDSGRSGEFAPTKPSWGWKFPRKVEELTHWPTKKRAVSEIADHPGHVTWSNPNLKVANKPIVLSWRGPRDRYAATIGHGGVAGGGTVPHEYDPTLFPSSLIPLALDTENLTDGPFVWINGHKVNTGVPKVIAACLHEYDPEGHPGEFVLRVCADRTIASLNRAMVVYDLVPESGDDGGTLKAFATASEALSVKATYLAADFSSSASAAALDNPGTAGKWDYWQRPHFNRSGTRLATLICLVGSNGTDLESHAVSFDFANGWAIDDDIVSVTDYTVNWTQESNGIGQPWDGTAHAERHFFVACDFEGDTFVFLDLVVTEEFVSSGVSQGSSSGKQYGEVNNATETTFAFEHSILGTLKEWTISSDFHGFYTTLPGGPTDYEIHADFTWTITNWGRPRIDDARAYEQPQIAFIGDLSKRSFAIGYPEQDVGSWTSEGHLHETRPDSVPESAVVCEATSVYPFMVFDVYFDGMKVLDAGWGSYAKTAAQTFTGTFTDFLHPADGSHFPGYTPGTNTRGHIARYNVSALGPPSFEGRSGAGVFQRAAQYLWGAAPMHQHCAIHPEKWAGYFGGAYYYDNAFYGNIRPLPHGLELFVVRPSGDGTTENPPPFVTEGAHPTLSVPVFMGFGSKQGETS